MPWSPGPLTRCRTGSELGLPQHRLSEDRSASHLQAASPEGLECSRNFRFRRQSRSTVRTENGRGTHRENEDSEPAERGSRRTRRTASPGAERGALKDGRVQCAQTGTKFPRCSCCVRSPLGEAPLPEQDSLPCLLALLTWFLLLKSYQHPGCMPPPPWHAVPTQ